MESVFEIVMGILFDAAVLCLVLRLENHEGEKKNGQLFLFGSFALGFLFGMVEKFMFGGNSVAFVFYVFGFIISADYFAMIFSKKSEKNESC